MLCSSSVNVVSGGGSSSLFASSSLESCTSGGTGSICGSSGYVGVVWIGWLVMFSAWLGCAMSEG